MPVVVDAWAAGLVGFDDVLLGQSTSLVVAPMALVPEWAEAGNPTVRVEKGWGSGDLQDLYPHTDGKLYTEPFGRGTEASVWAGVDKLLVEIPYNQAASDTASDQPVKIDDARRVLLDVSTPAAPAFAGYSTGTQDVNQHATQRGYELPSSVTLQTNDHPFSAFAAIEPVNSEDVYLLQNDVSAGSAYVRIREGVADHFALHAIAVGKYPARADPIAIVIGQVAVDNARGIATDYSQRGSTNGIVFEGFTFTSSATTLTWNLFGPTNSLRGKCFAVLISENDLTEASIRWGGIPSNLGRTFAAAIRTDAPSVAFPYANAVVPMDLDAETADIPIKLIGKPLTEYEAQWQSSGYSSVGTTNANGILNGALSAQAKGNGTLDVREVGGSTPVSIANVAVGIVLFAMGESGADGRGAYVAHTIPTGSLRLNRANWTTGNQGAATVAIASAGTGYTVSDALTISGGTGTQAQLTVTSVGGSGEITGVALNTAALGSYSAVPSSPVSVTGGTGSGATFNMTWGNSKEWWKRLCQLLYDEYSCVIGVTKEAAGSTAFRGFGAPREWSVDNVSIANPRAPAGLNRALGMQADFLTPNFWIWDLGKNDAAFATTEADFEAEFTALLAYYRTATGNSNIKFWPIISGDNTGVPFANTDTIRKAQRDLWETSGFEALGSFAHLEGDLDGVHFNTQAQKQAAADVAYRHLRGSGRAPQYSSGLISGSDLVITFTGGVSPLTLSGTLATDDNGWSIEDDNGARTITGIAVSGLQITLTLDQALVGTVHVQFGSGDTSQGTTLLDSDATTPLPPEPFGPVDIL